MVFDISTRKEKRLQLENGVGEHTKQTYTHFHLLASLGTGQKPFT